MRLLFIGYSNIVQKRVLHAAKRVPDFTHIDVASRKALDHQLLRQQGINGRLYNDYALALDESNADVAYISLVNSEHAVWAERALSRGFHVIVDKPAFVEFSDAEKLVNLAERRNVSLAEAIVFGYHPQVGNIKEAFQRMGTQPSRVSTAFSFPPLNQNDFRYSLSCGGGSLLDLGPYAVATGRLIFDSMPDEIIGRVVTRGGGDNVDTAFSLMMTFPEGRSLVGHFGFDTEYHNKISILAPGGLVEADRFYTTPPEFMNKINVRTNNQMQEITCDAGDSFALFLDDFAESVRRKDWRKFSQSLVENARLLDELKKSCGEE